MADGGRRDADILIGADGLHSVLRPVLNGPDAPFFTGQVAWRAVIPAGGQAEIVFDAGFGDSWATVPADLAQAVMIIAAQFYETRGGVSGTVAFPAEVIRILAPYRNLRLIAGGRS